MKLFKHIDIFISFLLMLFFLFFQPVTAIEYMHIGGRPANPDPAVENSQSWFIYNLEPGKSKQDALVVFNNYDSELDILVYAADGVKSSSGGFALKQLVEGKIEVGSWVKFYPAPVPEVFQELFIESDENIVSFCTLQLEESDDWTADDLKDFDDWCQGQDSVELTLESMNRDTIDFVFSVPLEIEVGEYTGGILIQKIEPAASAVEGGVTLTTRVGIRIYQTVPGDIIRDLAILKFDIQKLYNEFDFKNWFSRDQSSKEILISTAVQNLGNVSINFTENLIITDELFGKKGENITDRNFQALRNDVFISGYPWPKPLFGKFSIVNNISYQDQNDLEQTVSSEVITLWIIPWREIFIAAIILSVLLLINQVFSKIKKKRFR